MLVKYIDLYLDKLEAHVHSLFPKINDPPPSPCSRVSDVVRTISTLHHLCEDHVSNDNKQTMSHCAHTNLMI